MELKAFLEQMEAAKAVDGSKVKDLQNENHRLMMELSKETEFGKGLEKENQELKAAVCILQSRLV